MKGKGGKGGGGSEIRERSREEEGRREGTYAHVRQEQGKEGGG